MIQNVPTADDLETISLRLYFSAWTSVANIVTEFNQIMGVLSENQAEWDTYAESAQNDLQGIFTLALQSQEIGIKSLIAKVSPYLLLKRHDGRPIVPGTHQYDFSDFPTLDASELIRVHNTFCSAPLTSEFSDDFEKLRRGRNKIAHLGVFNERLDPHQLISLLFKHYTTLYPTRDWLPDRLFFASTGRWADFDGGGDWSPTGAVLIELWEIKDDLTPEQWRIVFGAAADHDKIVCPRCADSLEAHTGGSEPYGFDVPTAFQSAANSGTCALCKGNFEIYSAACSEEQCDGTSVAKIPDFAERCTTCGIERD